MSSIRTPILLLDVDGVLNAVGPDAADRWRCGVFNGFTIYWDPSITARLREWHESGRVEIQWLTTWADNADKWLAEPLGLPRGLRTRASGAAPTGFLAAAREVAEEEPGRRIVWIDDDLAAQAADTGDWLADHPHVLVVAPDLYVGVTHEQLDAIEAWL
jgi:hypothetical protein